MSDVLAYLDCGCAIMKDGRRVWCPTCADGARHEAAAVEHDRIERAETGAYVHDLEQERDRLLEALTLPRDVIADLQNFLAGETYDLADDAIVKLSDAKGRAFSHITAGWLRRVVELTTDEDGEPLERRTALAMRETAE